MNLHIHRFLIPSAFLLLIPMLAQALSSDKLKPIAIEADWQEFTNDGEIIYRGNVLISQGSIQISADKVVITPAKGKRPEQLTAQGEPTHYQQQTDQGEWVNASAQKIIYDSAIKKVKLFEAILKQGRHEVESEYIEYNTDTQNFTAKRAKTIRYPDADNPAPTQDNAASDPNNEKDIAPVKEEP